MQYYGALIGWSSKASDILLLYLGITGKCTFVSSMCDHDSDRTLESIFSQFSTLMLYLGAKSRSSSIVGKFTSTASKWRPFWIVTLNESSDLQLHNFTFLLFEVQWQHGGIQLKNFFVFLMIKLLFYKSKWSIYQTRRFLQVYWLINCLYVPTKVIVLIRPGRF